jgi:hypothetical protein
MLEEFARCYQVKVGSCFDVGHRQIRYVSLSSLWYIVLTFCLRSATRCLAHIINLATQAVISTRTKSKYYNGDTADDHLPKDSGNGERDEIGIVRAVCIKVRTVYFLLDFGANRC